MTFNAALIKEQGVTFCILSVKQHVHNIPEQRQRVLLFGKQKFGNIPIV